MKKAALAILLVFTCICMFWLVKSNIHPPLKDAPTVSEKNWSHLVIDELEQGFKIVDTRKIHISGATVKQCNWLDNGKVVVYAKKDFPLNQGPTSFEGYKLSSHVLNKVETFNNLFLIYID